MLLFAPRLRARPLRGLLILLLALAALGPVAPAQAQATEAPASAAPAVTSGVADPGLASPLDTLLTFLAAMSGEEIDRVRAVECLDVSQIAPEAAADAASRLYRILNRVEDIDLTYDRSIPGPGELTNDDGPVTVWRLYPRERRSRAGADGVRWMKNFDRARTLAELVPDLRLELARGADGLWRFSAATVAGVETLAPRLEALDPLVGGDETRLLTTAERIARLFPARLRVGPILGVLPWQWASIAILVVAAMSLDLLIRMLLAGFSRRVIRRRGGTVEAATIRRTVRPFGMAVAAVVMLRALPMLGLPSSALLVLGPALRFYAMLAVVWAVFRVIDLIGAYFDDRARSTENRFDDLVVPLLRKSAKIIVGVFGLIYIADAFHVEIGPLLTGLGIGGVGFAFAAKDTLENFFGSITVIIDRPFEVGDWVVIGETEGVVEELGLRSVRVRTFYNSLVTIPTAILVRARVDNYGQRKYRRWKTHLNLLYETAPDAVEAFCEGIKELIRAHPYTRKDYYEVWLHGFGPSSIDVLVYMFFEAPDWSTELRERHRLMLDIMRLADRLGVSFAYPTQRLVVEQSEPPVAGDLPEIETIESSPFGHDVLARRRGQQVARAMTADERWRQRVPPPYRLGADDPVDADQDGTPDPPATQIETKGGGDA